jgi:hypothetical protein
MLRRSWNLTGSIIPEHRKEVIPESNRQAGICPQDPADYQLLVYMAWNEGDRRLMRSYIRGDREEIRYNSGISYTRFK